MRKKSFILILLMSMMLFFSSCQAGGTQNEHKLNFFTSMHTRVDLRFENQAVLDKNFDSIKEIFDKYHELTDNFNQLPQDSLYLTNIKQINDKIKNASTSVEIEIDQPLYELLVYAEAMMKQTDGYFNHLIGEVIDVWKQVIATYQDEIVPIDVISKVTFEAKTKGEAFDLIEQPLVLMKREQKYFMVAKAGVKIDLGALAKGYALNEVRIYLENSGITEYMVSAGSSSIIVGSKKGNQSYKIGLSNPIFGQTLNQDQALSDHLFYGYYYLKNSGITTSGNQEQYVMGEDGVKYHHIISPKTFKPANIYQSLWIVGSQMHLLDAYSTALFSMEPTKVKSFINENELFTGTFNQNLTYTIYQKTANFEVFYDAKGKAVFLHEDVS